MRSLLCVPANKANMLKKALTTEADGIIIDLEDSVIPNDKELGRENVLDFFKNINTSKFITLRINERGYQDNSLDINLIKLLRKSALKNVMLPKIHSKSDIEFWSRKIPKSFGLDVQIESPLGLVNSAAIAAHPRVHSLSFGPADFMAALGMPARDPGISTAPRALEYPLLEIVISAHAHKKLAFDGPYFHLSDSQGLHDAAFAAKALGADGKWAIHPDQITTCNEVFTPSEEEILRAQSIIAAFGNSSGAINFNGIMIDEASKKVAERLLERATHSHK